MKRYILGLGILVIGFSSCNNKKTKNTETDLFTQKEQIEKQIDSLNKLLIDIENKLGENKSVEIPAIEAKKLVPEKFEHYIEVQGNVDTDGNVLVIPEAMGKVMKIYKNEGQQVRKGEVIMRLDDSTLRNQIAEVRTQYDLAKTAYERQKRLWDKKIGSEMAYLQAKTKKESLAGKLKTLHSQLNKMQVKAPISGVIDDMMIKEGEMAAPQRPVARVVNLKKVYMEADISEKYLQSVRKGMPVLIEFPETGQNVSAALSYVGNFIHPNNRTFKIRVNILNLDGSLKPNLTGNIKIKDFEKQDVIVLPLSLVQEDREGNNYVFVLVPSDEKDIYEVKKRILETGPVYKDKIMIKSGLNSGDIIALQGARGLTVGDKVKISHLINAEQNVDSQNNSHTNQKDEKSTNEKYYVVKKGETLYRIHKKFGVSLENLRKWNDLKSDQLIAGQKLIIKKQ